MNLKSKKSFTLIELLVAVAILAYVLCGLLAMYISSLNLIAISKNLSIAITAAQGLVEEIRNVPFPHIVDDYNNLKFIVNNIPLSKGVVYVDDTDPELLRVIISVCWHQGLRFIGEDDNLNGMLDAGEDKNSNGIIDSPVQVASLIANR